MRRAEGEDERRRVGKVERREEGGRRTEVGRGRRKEGGGRSDAGSGRPRKVSA